MCCGGAYVCCCYYLQKPLVTRDFPDLSGVLPCYLDLKEVFNKVKATSPPPQHPYNCPIDLLPSAAPRAAFASSENQAMKEYIASALKAGIVRLSPAGVGFFFVEKDKSLQPCINYCGLNVITIKNRYPLPLISGFELLKRAKVFTKLDLRIAYHLDRNREGDCLEKWKTAFKTPSGHYEYLVMPFGLTNAPAVFQALLNDVLRDMLNICVFV